MLARGALASEFSSESRFHRLSSSLLAIPLMVIGLGNLLLPELAQTLLPFDYLLPTLALCGVVSIYRLRNVLMRVKHLLPLALFFFGCLLGVLSSTGSSYAQNKLLTFGIIALLATTVATAPAQPSLQRALGAGFAVVGCLTSAALIVFGSTSATGRASLFELNPIGLARVTGLAAVIAIALLFAGEARKKSRLFWSGLVLLGLLGTVATVLTGSRGPLVAAAVAFAVVLFTCVRTKRLRTSTVATLVITALAGYFAVSIFGGEGLGRLESGVDSGRNLLYAQTVEIIRSRPWTGVGWGNFPMYIFDFSSDDGTLYPHNILLELWVEGGLPALVGFLVLATTAFVRQYRAARDSTWPFVMLAVLTFSLTNALFSSDVVGNRMMWLIIIVGLLSPKEPVGDRSSMRDRGFAPRSHQDRMGPLGERH